MVEEVEAKDFRFRQLTKVKVSTPVSPSNERCSLLCVSNEYGLTFVGCNEGVQVFCTSVLYAIDKDQDLKHKEADLSCLKAELLPTPAPPQDISLSCDNLTLSVCLKIGGKLQCFFFDVRVLSSKVAKKTPFCSVPLATENGIGLSGCCWNPNPDYSDLLVISLTNGTLYLLSVKEQAVLVCQSANFRTVSVCWSPKGKQLAAGTKDGEVLQLAMKNNFEEKQRYACPDLFNGVSMQVSDLFWVSTHEFSLVYTPQSGQDVAPNSVFLTTSKNAPPAFLGAEDVYYGDGNRENKFHFSFLQKWGILISCSSNASDTVVFGKDPSKDWQLYELEDTGRAEFQVDRESNEDTYASGMALDFTSKEEVVISDSLTLPPSPLLLLLSDHGILSPFTVLKFGSNPDLKVMVNPPKPFPSTAARTPKPSALQAAPMSSAVPTPTSSVSVATGTISGLFSGQPNLRLGQSMGPTGGQAPAAGGVSSGGLLSGQVTGKSGGTLTGQALMITPGSGGPSAGFSQAASAPTAAVLGVKTLTGQLPAPLFGQSAGFSQGAAASHGTGLGQGGVRLGHGPTAAVSQGASVTGGQGVNLGVLGQGARVIQGAGIGGLGHVGGLGQGAGAGGLGQGVGMGQSPKPSTFTTTQPPIQTSLGGGGGGAPPPYAGGAPPPYAGVPPPYAGATYAGLGMMTLSGTAAPTSHAIGRGMPQVSQTAAGGSVLGGAPPVSHPSSIGRGRLGGVPLPSIKPGGGASTPAWDLSVGSKGPLPLHSSTPLTSGHVPTGGKPPGLLLQNVPHGQQPHPLQGTSAPRAAIGLPISNVATGTLGPQQHAQPPRGPPTGPTQQHTQQPRGPPTGPPQQHALPPRGPPTGPPQQHAQQPRGPPTGPPQPHAQQPRGPPTGPPQQHAQQPRGPPTGPPQQHAQQPRGPPTGPPQQHTQPPRGPPTGPPQQHAQPPRGPPTGPPQQNPQPRHGPPQHHSQPHRDLKKASQALEGHERIDSDFAATIRDQAERFSREMSDLKQAMSTVYGGWESSRRAEDVTIQELGNLEGLQRVQEETFEVAEVVKAATLEFKKLRQSCGLLEEDTLKCLEIHEQIKVELKKRSDMNYISFEKLRPLDSHSSEKLANMRRKFLQVKQALQGVTSQLESQLQSMYEKRRQKGRDPLKVPSLHVVYSTLKDHSKKNRLQGVEVERLMQQMKTLRLIPQCWQSSDFPNMSPISPSSRTSPLRPSGRRNLDKRQSPGSGFRGGGTEKRRKQSPSDGSRVVTRQQMTKLRDYFSNITMSPVKQVHTAPLHQLSPEARKLSSVASESTLPSGSTTPHDSDLDQPDYGSLSLSASASGIDLASVIPQMQSQLSSTSQPSLQLFAQGHGTKIVSAQHPPAGTVVPVGLMRPPPGRGGLSRDSPLSASQSSISTQLSSKSQDSEYREPDVTATAEGLVFSPHSKSSPHRSKYDVLVSPDRKIAVNKEWGQFNVDSSPAPAVPESSTRPGTQKQAMQKQATPIVGTVPSSLSSVFPGVSGVQLPPPPSSTSLGGRQQQYPPHAGPGMFMLASNPPINVYPTKAGDGTSILHGSLPQLSTLTPGDSAGNGGSGPGAGGELRKMDRFDDLTQIRAGTGDGSRLLSSASSASVPNVYSSDPTLGGHGQPPPPPGSGSTGAPPRNHTISSGAPATAATQQGVAKPQGGLAATTTTPFTFPVPAIPKATPSSSSSAPAPPPGNLLTRLQSAPIGPSSGGSGGEVASGMGRMFSVPASTTSSGRPMFSLGQALAGQSQPIFSGNLPNLFNLGPPKPSVATPAFGTTPVPSLSLFQPRALSSSMSVQPPAATKPSASPFAFATANASVGGNPFVFTPGTFTFGAGKNGPLTTTTVAMTAVPKPVFGMSGATIATTTPSSKPTGGIGGLSLPNTVTVTTTSASSVQPVVSAVAKPVVATEADKGVQPGPPAAVSKPKGNEGPAVGTDEDEGIHVSGSPEVLSVGSGSGAVGAEGKPAWTKEEAEVGKSATGSVKSATEGSEKGPPHSAASTSTPKPSTSTPQPMASAVTQPPGLPAVTSAPLPTLPPATSDPQPLVPPATSAPVLSATSVPQPTVPPATSAPVLSVASAPQSIGSPATLDPIVSSTSAPQTAVPTSSTFTPHPAVPSAIPSVTSASQLPTSSPPQPRIVTTTTAAVTSTAPQPTVLPLSTESTTPSTTAPGPLPAPAVPGIPAPSLLQRPANQPLPPTTLAPNKVFPGQQPLVSGHHGGSQGSLQDMGDDMDATDFDTGGMDLGGMGLGQPGPSRAANPFTSPFASALGSAATTRPADSAPSGTSFLRSSALGSLTSRPVTSLTTTQGTSSGFGAAPSFGAAAGFGSPPTLGSGVLAGSVFGGSSAGFGGGIGSVTGGGGGGGGSTFGGGSSGMFGGSSNGVASFGQLAQQQNSGGGAFGSSGNSNGLGMSSSLSGAAFQGWRS